MPETVILNKNVNWDDNIKDSIGPDYGFSRTRPGTRVFAKAPGGQPGSRETQNAGHAFQLSWLNRSFACVQRIKYFAEQFEDGYFTIIDHDGGGRHYVGRFTGPVAETQRGNDSYDIQGLAFEEVPGVPMLEYPGNWGADSVSLHAFNDFGTQLLSTSGMWTVAMTASMTTSAGTITPYKVLNDAGMAGDFATMEYRGYGYQLWMQKGPAYGIVQLYLDGTATTTVDLYSPAQLGPQMVSMNLKVPLDLHRVKVAMLGTKNAASSATAASWCYLQVMR